MIGDTYYRLVPIPTGKRADGVFPVRCYNRQPPDRAKFVGRQKKSPMRSKAGEAI
jgi:hypothetical protein